MATILTRTRVNQRPPDLKAGVIITSAAESGCQVDNYILCGSFALIEEEGQDLPLGYSPYIWNSIILISYGLQTRFWCHYSPQLVPCSLRSPIAINESIGKVNGDLTDHIPFNGMYTVLLCSLCSAMHSLFPGAWWSVIMQMLFSFHHPQWCAHASSAVTFV